jgi:SAM-dependent methyltransferase
MNEFEKRYYESEAFWENEMLQDERNFERFRITASLIQSDVHSLLDAGCGNGVFVNYLSEHRKDLAIFALDRSKAALKHVKTNPILGDVSELPFADNHFDCITCLEVLEHLPIEVYNKTLRELARVSKKYLIISVPYKEVLENSYNQCPSCKTIFNYELHLRNFDDNSFTGMFKGLGYKNVKVIKAGPTESLRYHRKFRKIFYPEQFLKWNSPVCPLCGYHETTRNVTNNATAAMAPPLAPKKRKLISYFTGLPRLFWPKDRSFYWIIGLFERE